LSHFVFVIKICFQYFATENKFWLQIQTGSRIYQSKTIRMTKMICDKN